MPETSDYFESSMRKVGKPQSSSNNRNGTIQPLLPLDIEARPVSQEAQPFLKWAGGKSQLISQLDEYFPESLERYVEPFIGGGAVFFHLRTRFPDTPAYLC